MLDFSNGTSPEELRRRLAINAACYRKKLALSQREVAERGEMHLRTYQRIEEQTINVTISSNMNFGVEQSQSISDPRKKDQTIAWTANNGNGKSVFEMYAGKGSKLAPTVNAQPGNNMVQGSLQVTALGSGTDTRSPRVRDQLVAGFAGGPQHR